MTRLSILSIAAFGIACEPTYDQALVDELKTAIPSESQLGAKAPVSKTIALGQTAIFPQMAAPVVHGINGNVTWIVHALDFIVNEVDPTSVDEDAQLAIWGPYEDDDFGTNAVMIGKSEEGEDFDYYYMLLRGSDLDQPVEEMSPVLFGGATPDPESDDHLAGVTLWDFEASRDFLNDNGQDPSTEHMGRFIAVYAKDMDPEQPENEQTFVVSAVRDFVDANEAGSDPLDLDYFYGRYDHVAEQTQIDFLHYTGELDIDGSTDGVYETLDVRMAFVNQGIGRAEVSAVGGSLESDQWVSAEECWDDMVKETYLLTELQADQSYVLYQEGEVTDCASPFESSLVDLGVPSLDDLDPEMLSALDHYASVGMDALSEE